MNSVTNRVLSHCGEWKKALLEVRETEGKIRLWKKLKAGTSATSGT